MIRELEREGWQEVTRTPGSHRQFKHPFRHGRVTVSGAPGDEVPAGTLSSIRRQSGLVLREGT
ncbi:MAG: type II toxin-antitoxin system HicA family toxin [Candidatus Dormibacteria bacterium]